MDTVLQEKKNLRKKMIAERNGIPEADRSIAEERLVSEITDLELFRSSENILLFASYGSEISTDGLIDKCLLLGKKVFLPKVEGKEITFYRVYDPDELDNCGYKGIREPAGDSVIFSGEYSKSLLIMPGVAFDEEGYRLGYGGGFYDRFLSGKDELVLRSIAIGFKVQEVSALPHDELDIKPGRVMLF